MARPITRVEILKAAENATVDLETAGRAYSVGRSKSYQLARSGEFPCRVVRVGSSYRVLTASWLSSLGMDGSEINDGVEGSLAANPSTPSHEHASASH